MNYPDAPSRPPQGSGGTDAESAGIESGADARVEERPNGGPASGTAKRRMVLWPVLAVTFALALGTGGIFGGIALVDPTQTPEYRELQAAHEHTERQRAALEERQEELEDRATAREETVNQREAKLKEAETALAKAQEAVKVREEAVTGAEAKKAANTITDGTWVVGRDMTAGTYRATAPVGSSCYWGIYRSGTNGDDIIQNDLPGGGQPMVTLSDGQDFKSSRCGKWEKQ